MRMSDWSSDGCSSDLHALAVLLGQTPQSFAGPATATTSLPHIAQIDVGAPADLLRRRPDIAAAERALAAATARRGVAEADLFPTVRLSGFIGLLAGGVGSLVSRSEGHTPDLQSLKGN